MTPGERELFTRIESNLDRVTALLVETAERQSVAEHQRAVDAENIRALARIADAHERRLTDLEGGQPE